MKRKQRNRGLPKLFQEKKEHRKRREKPKDPFVERNESPLALLKEFLKNRKEYLKKFYSTEQSRSALYEVELYEQTLDRIIKVRGIDAI